MRPIALHLGAHKTATTWLQHRLVGGTTALAAAGVDHEPMPRLRAAFTDGFDRLCRGLPGAPPPGALRDILATLVARGPGRLLLSDENLIGDCFVIVRSGRLYPHIAGRIDRLAELLPHPPVRVVLTIRDYAGFFAAAYGEALRFRAFEPFEALRARLRLDDGLWPRIVAALVTRFGTDAVRIMRFDRLEPGLPALVDALCGRPVCLPDSTERREGLSAPAVAALAQAAARGDTRPARRRAAEAAAAFPRAAGHPPYNPWSAEDAAMLGALYARHVEAIDRRWPGILL